MGKDYVAGFMFSRELDKVAVIRKLKPEWQRGKLNGIGGKVEAGEGAFSAMAREFEEETGCKTWPESWSHFLEMSGGNDGGEGFFRIWFFARVGDLSALRTVEEEEVKILEIDDVTPARTDMVENVPWLIGLARDHLKDGRPQFVEVRYPA